MKKAEVLRYCKEKAEEGYITHLMILEIYNDEEDIPDEIVDLVCHLPEPPNPYRLMMFGSLEGIRRFEEACEDFARCMAQNQIADEMKKKICKS